MLNNRMREKHNTAPPSKKTHITQGKYATLVATLVAHLHSHLLCTLPVQNHKLNVGPTVPTFTCEKKAADHNHEKTQVQHVHVI